MSGLADCTNSLSAKDILRAATKKGPPFYINVLGLSSYCSQFQAVLDAYVPTIPDATQLAAQNTMACGLYEDGVWDKLDLFYVLANGDSPNCLLNWITPGSFTLVPQNFPTFVAWEGITGNGLDQYLDTTYNPTTDAVNYSQNSTSQFFYSRTDANDTSYDMGARDNAGWSMLASKNSSGGFIIRINDLTTDVTPVADSLGMNVMSREASNIKRGYKNKSLIINSATASTAIPNFDFYLLAYNNRGIGAASFSVRQCSIAGVGGALTQTDVNNLTDRCETYMDFLGKGVI